MELNYICTWEKDKSLTWSGTTYSLYKALKNKCNVNDYDITLNNIEKKIIKLSQLRLNKNSIKTNKLYSFVEEKMYKNKFKRVDKSNECVNLQIGDYIKTKDPYYVYQDLSIDSLIYYKVNSQELFKYSGYQYATENDLKKRRSRQLEFYKNSEGIFTMSKWLQENLINYTGIGKEKVHHVGAGINIDVNKIKKVNKKNNKILFVGRDFYRKGGDIVYEAFKILKEKYNPDAELFIIGPKEFPYSEIYDGVNFLGDLPYDKLSYYFNECDIFCMPSRFEAYGLVFIEALVYGLPCIGRNEFAMKEFIQDGYNGFLIEDDDKNKLAIKMNDLLKNKDIKNNVLKNRERYIAEYSWDNVANKIIDVIKKNK